MFDYQRVFVQKNATCPSVKVCWIFATPLAAFRGCLLALHNPCEDATAGRIWYDMTCVHHVYIYNISSQSHSPSMKLSPRLQIGPPKCISIYFNTKRALIPGVLIQERGWQICCQILHVAGNEEPWKMMESGKRRAEAADEATFSDHQIFRRAWSAPFFEKLWPYDRPASSWDIVLIYGKELLI